jgi:lipopolysaccharide exporter
VCGPAVCAEAESCRANRPREDCKRVKSEWAGALQWTAAAAAVTTITESSRVLITSRLLGPVEFGLMALVNIVIGIAQAFQDAGVGAAIIHRQNISPRELSSLYWLNVAVGCVLCLVVSLGAPLAARIFREERVIPLIMVAGSAFVISALGLQFELLLRKEMEFNTIARVDIVAGVVSVLFALCCGLNGMGAWTLVLSQLASVATRAAWFAGIGYRRFRPEWTFSLADIRPFLSFGAFQLGTRLIASVRTRIDQILIGLFVGVPELGMYNFAHNLVSKPQARINPIITRVAFPAFARVQKDTEKLREGYLGVVKAISALNAPLLLGLAGGAHLFVPLLFGTKWISAIPVIQWLCLLAVVRSIHNPLAALRLAIGRADSGFWWEVASIVVSFPAILLGGFWGGIMGVAIALLLVEGIAAFPAYVLLMRPVVGRCGWEYAQAVGRPLLAAVLMGCAVSLVAPAFPVVPGAIVSIVGGGVM